MSLEKCECSTHTRMTRQNAQNGPDGLPVLWWQRGQNTGWMDQSLDQDPVEMAPTQHVAGKMGAGSEDSGWEEY